MDTIPKHVLTDTVLRARWACKREKVLYVEPGTVLTPSAADFIREQGITVSTRQSSYRKMPVTPIKTVGGTAQFIDAVTGAALTEKAEDMTHLHGNVLVAKTHPRIALRGKLDSLGAQILSLQVEASEAGEGKLTEELGELLGYVRAIIAAEVKEEPMPQLRLLGMDSAELRETSHHPQKTIGVGHVEPDYRMGRVCIALNRLRTQVREVELAAAQAFAREDGSCGRRDILEGLNRLSSCVYILFCRRLASSAYERENET